MNFASRPCPYCFINGPNCVGSAHFIYEPPHVAILSPSLLQHVHFSLVRERSWQVYPTFSENVIHVVSNGS